MGEVHGQRLNVGQGTHRFVERTHAHQHPLNVRVFDNGHATLNTLSRIGNRLLIRALRCAPALQSNLEPRLIHHREHAGESIIFLTYQVANRAVLITVRHDTSGASVNPQLVFHRNRIGVISVA